MDLLGIKNEAEERLEKLQKKKKAWDNINTNIAEEQRKVQELNKEISDKKKREIIAEARQLQKKIFHEIELVIQCPTCGTKITPVITELYENMTRQALIEAVCPKCQETIEHSENQIRAKKIIFCKMPFSNNDKSVYRQARQLPY